MAAKAQFRTSQEVLNYYNEQDEPAWEIHRFAVSGSKNRDAIYYGTDKEVGLRKLTDELASKQSDDCENYVLLLGNMVKKEFVPVYSKVFTPNPKLETGTMMGGYGVQSYGQNQALTEILNELRAQRAERLAELREQEDELAEPEDDGILAGQEKVERLVNQIHGIMTSPVTSAVLSMMGMFNKPQVQQLAGTHSKDDVHQIVDTLLSKGVTPDDLAKLASMDQKQIDFLLSMLRK